MANGNGNAMVTSNWEHSVTNAGTWNDFTTTTGGAYVTNWSPYAWTFCWCHQNSKIEKAYQVVRGLMKAKLVQVKSLERFFCLMDEVQKAL